MISIETEIPNIEELADEQIFDILTYTTFGLEREMSVLMASSEPSGRIYKRGKTEHQASAPGEPPAIDTTNLFQSISADINENDLAGEITMAEYGLFLETGTDKIEARPFIEPSLENVLKELNV